MKRFALAFTALSMAITAPAYAGPGDEFQKLLDDHWSWTLSQSPTFATSLGVRDYDDRLGSLTLESMDKAREKRQEFLTRLRAIDRSGLDKTDQLNARLFERDLEIEIEAGEFGQRAILFTTYYGWHSEIAGLSDRLPFFNKADYESYLKRLKDVPRYNAEGIATTKWGIENGYVQPCAPLENFSKTITAHIVEDITGSVFMKPFENQPSSISDTDWASLKAQAEKSVKSDVIPAFQAWAATYEEDYKPNCRSVVGASSMPEGGDYYAHRIRAETTTDMTAEQIHRIGLSEVARIRSEMEEVIKGANFDGDFKAYQDYLRTNPALYAKTPEALMERSAYISKRIDGELPKLFTRLPAMPYTVKPVPEEIAEGTTTAYYEAPAGDGTRAGVYRVNTSKLDQRPLFEMEALTLHEAVPGHHFQIALQQELDLPNFRRFGGITAFVEGWALYAERLGLEVGFYQTPETDFGRLSYEMWRACRLVVDTGMHAKGWTKQQAIDFMAENTALSMHNIEAEVNRYITWPGQALGYKIGELKIRELRERAENALGSDFDVRKFHDAVLENGAIPLSVLEDIINTWIEEQRMS